MTHHTVNISIYVCMIRLQNILKGLKRLQENFWRSKELQRQGADRCREPLPGLDNTLTARPESCWRQGFWALNKAAGTGW